MTRWAERERREGQVCREVYLSKEVVVQEKGAGQPSVAAGRLLFVDTAMPVHQWWEGGFVSVCQCVCARALSLMHACTGGCGRTLRTPTHADIHTAVHVHAGTQASGLSLARKKRRLSVESMGNSRPQAQ